VGALVYLQPLLTVVVASSHCLHRLDTAEILDEALPPSLAVYNTRCSCLATVQDRTISVYDAHTGVLVKDHYQVID
jgi:hypothetical protein